MDYKWDDAIERIRGMNGISEHHRRRLVRSVNVLKGNLGGEGWPDTYHPLLQDVQITLNSHADWLVSRLANDIASTKNAGIWNILRRIRIPSEYFGATAELEVGGVLARSGCRLMTEPDVGGKRPDFLCQRNGVEFIAEVKMLGIGEKTQEANQTVGQVITACKPFFPAGRIIRSLPPHELKNVVRKLDEAASRVRVGSPQEVIIPDTLKIYLVHDDEPDRVRIYDKWHRAPENSDIQDNSGLLGPPIDRTDLVRILAKIHTFAGERQIPKERMGVLFITGNFMIGDGDVEVVVEGVLKHISKLPNIPAVVLISIRTFTLSPNRRRIKEEADYVDVDYRVAPYVVERVLVVKNRSCGFTFDHGIWEDMYAERNKFAYR